MHRTRIHLVPVAGPRPGPAFVAPPSLQPSKLRNVDLAEVRGWILRWSGQDGVNISAITFDGFQSKDSVQQLRRAGFPSCEASVDRTMEPYESFRSALYQGRIALVAHELLRVELGGLEHVMPRNKVDHPRHLTKDVADAVCGAVWGITHNREGRAMTGVGFTGADGTVARPNPTRPNPVRPVGNYYAPRVSKAPVEVPSTLESRAADLIVAADRALMSWAASRRNLGLPDAVACVELVSAGMGVDDESKPAWNAVVGTDRGGPNRLAGDEARAFIKSVQRRDIAAVSVVLAGWEGQGVEAQAA